jgi:hypothetical protein
MIFSIYPHALYTYLCIYTFVYIYRYVNPFAAALRLLLPSASSSSSSSSSAPLRAERNQPAAGLFCRMLGLIFFLSRMSGMSLPHSVNAYTRYTYSVYAYTRRGCQVCLCRSFVLGPFDFLFGHFCCCIRDLFAFDTCEPHFPSLSPRRAHTGKKARRGTSLGQFLLI